MAGRPQYILDELAMIERHIIQCELNVSAQRARVARLERTGRDATSSRNLLDNLEAALALHYAYRSRTLAHGTKLARLTWRALWTVPHSARGRSSQSRQNPLNRSGANSV
jgi:hypothetical protein